ncbi:MAG: hypothetical protein R3190_08730 [Thermoanaerobaculia bacterium]|nr:hypothetical protein [Thermoanaerobaculia bacterium]
MKKRLATLSVALAAVLAVGLLPLAVLADHHVNGTWVLDVDLGGQGGQATFELEETEPGKLTGTYNGAVGTAEVTGTVSGNEVSFSFESDQAGKVSYKGKVDGDAMEGTCEYGALGSGTFKGQRKSE